MLRALDSRAAPFVGSAALLLIVALATMSDPRVVAASAGPSAAMSAALSLRGHAAPSQCLAIKHHDTASTASTAQRALRHADIYQLVRPLTMVSLARLQANAAAVDYIARAQIEGDIVEMGVARGGSAASLALASIAAGSPRTTHLYDTFAGLPAADVAKDGQRAMEDTGLFAHGVEEVRGNLESAPLSIPPALLRYHAGDVLATPPADLPCAIAVLRMDTDWYASYVWMLREVVPRVVPGGVVIADDYGHWPGAGRAVDEFFESLPPGRRPVRVVIDYTGVMWCMPRADGSPCPLDTWVATAPLTWSDVGTAG